MRDVDRTVMLIGGVILAGLAAMHVAARFGVASGFWG